MKNDNLRWGARKIVGELRKIGITVSKTTILKILAENGSDPGRRNYEQSWLRFLRSHAKRYFACDFLTVETAFLRRLYVFAIMDVTTLHKYHRNQKLGTLVSHSTPGNAVQKREDCRQFPGDISNNDRITIQTRTDSWLNFFQTNSDRIHSAPSNAADEDIEINTTHTEIDDHANVWGRIERDVLTALQSDETLR